MTFLEYGCPHCDFKHTQRYEGDGGLKRVDETLPEIIKRFRAEVLSHWHWHQTGVFEPYKD